MIEETLQSTKYEVMQKKKQVENENGTKNKALLLLEKEIKRVEIERRI